MTTPEEGTVTEPITGLPAKVGQAAEDQEQAAAIRAALNAQRAPGQTAAERAAIDRGVPEGTRGTLAFGYVHDERNWAAGGFTADQAEWMVARLAERGCTGFVIRDGLEYARALLPPGTRVTAPRKHWGSQVGTVLDGYELHKDGEQALVRFADGLETTWWIRGLDAVGGHADAAACTSLPVVTVEQRPGGAWAVRRDGRFLPADGAPPGQTADSPRQHGSGFALHEALVLAARHAPAFATHTTAPGDSPFFPFEEGHDFADYIILAGRHAPMTNRWTEDSQWQLSGDNTVGYTLTRHGAPGNAGQPQASVVPCTDRGGWHTADPVDCDDAVLFPSARSALIVHAPDPAAVAAIAVLWPGTAPEAKAQGALEDLPRRDGPAAPGRSGRADSQSGPQARPARPGRRTTGGSGHSAWQPRPRGPR